MQDFLAQYGWWVLGLALLIGEVLIPGIFFLWLGLAALLTGVVAWVLSGLGWQWEMLLFGVFALALVFGVRPFVTRDLEKESENPALNERLNAMIGRTGVMSTDLRQGQGRARIGDTEWRVTGPDMAAGTAVRVVGADREQMVLVVEPA
jgi:membrane protein implicated in regulation of membrane protease activity